MAYGDTFHPAGTARDVKVRGPVWVALWSLTPYSIFWFYFTVKDLSEYGKAKGYDLGQNPTMSLLAVLFGWVLLFIPPIIAIYRFVKRIQQAQRLAGSSEQANGWLVLIMFLVGLSFVANGYLQSELNKAWAAEGGPVPQKDDMPQTLSSGPSGTMPSSTSGSPEQPVSSERPPGA
ncbi:MAG TPA: DUF4234 domain-containing protein [Solirubrobacteraceae bacterium]|jgi:hypothetical protein